MSSYVDMKSKVFKFPSTNEVKTSNWSSWRLRVKAVMESKHFDMLMGIIILGNLVLIVFETNAAADCKTQGESCSVPLEVQIANHCFMAIYSAELLTRLYAYRGWFFHSPWHGLDTLVVASGLIDIAMSSQQNEDFPKIAAVVRVIRLVRLARTFRLVWYFPELQALLRGFGGAMKAMFWGFVIIMLMLGLWSLLAVEFVHPVNLSQDVNQDVEDKCKNAFSSVERAIVFFFQTLVAGDSWGTCTIPIMEDKPATALIFALSLVSVQLGFTNLILAVIVDAAARAKETDYESRLQEKEQHERESGDVWRSIIEHLDVDKNGTISLAELQKGYKERKGVSKILGLLDIDWQDLETLHSLMDVDNTGEVSYMEFFHCLRKAHTQDMRVYLMNVKLQMSYMTSLITKQLAMLRTRFEMAGDPFEPATSAAVAADVDKAKNVHQVRHVDLDPFVPGFPSEPASSTAVAADSNKARSVHQVRHVDLDPFVPGFPSEPPSSTAVAADSNKARNVHQVRHVDLDPFVPGFSSEPPSSTAVAADSNKVQHMDGDPFLPTSPREPANSATVSAEIDKYKEPKPAVRATAEAMDEDLVSSYMASLDKLRSELEQRLDEISQTAAAAAVTLAQNAELLEASVTSCVSKGPLATQDSGCNGTAPLRASSLEPRRRMCL